MDEVGVIEEGREDGHERPPPGVDAAATVTHVPGDQRTVRPVLWWAGVGGAFVAVQIWVFSSWILSGDVGRIGPGPDPVPGATEAWTIGAQIVLSLGAVAIVGWVVRRCIRQRRLTLEGVILVAWVSIIWGNPLENMTQVVRLVNASMLNVGTWAGHLPGAVSSGAERVPEPIVYTLALYFGYGALSTFMIAGLKRRIEARRPGLSGLRVFGITYMIVFLTEIVVEGLWIRTEIMAYPGGIHAISLFPGERYQLPLHIPALVALTLVLFAWVYASSDWQRRLWGGIDRLRGSERRRTGVKVLAAIGAFNVVIMLYAVPAQVFAIHAGRYPDMPSYLNNGVCGEDVGRSCPGPETPIFKPDGDPGR